MLSPNMVQALYKARKDYDIIHIHHPDPMACVALYFSGYKGKVVLHWHSDILKQKHLLKLYQPFQKWLLQRADIIVGTTPTYVQESKYLADVQHKIKDVVAGDELASSRDVSCVHIKLIIAKSDILIKIWCKIKISGSIHSQLFANKIEKSGFSAAIRTEQPENFA